MKKVSLAVLVLTSAALPGSAFARTFSFHGDICRPIFGLDDADYDQHGVRNVSTSPLRGFPAPNMTVECPLPLSYPDSGPPPAVTLVETKVYDGNTTYDVTCALEQVNDDGAVLVSVAGSSSGGGPGSPAADMTFMPPPGADASGYWRLRCTLPGPQADAEVLAFSYLVASVVHTSE